MKYRTNSVLSPLTELTKRCLAAGNLSGKGKCLLFIYYLKMLLVMPAAFLQKRVYAKRIGETIVDDAPVFILGHYRSGTTYLHKLMAADSKFGYLSYYDIICPNTSLLFGNRLKQVLQFLISRLNMKTAFFNNSVPCLDEPAEEERFLINKSSAYTDYWRFVFPLCWNQWHSCLQLMKKDAAYEEHWKKEYRSLLQLASYKNNGKPLLLKSPPNTERIPCILSLFPNAKFIYISRHPHHVFYSMRNLWQKAIKKFCLQNISDPQIEELVFTHYEHLIEQYRKDKELIPPENLIEVSYEALASHPLSVLERIYRTLDLQGFQEVRSCFEAQLRKEKKYRTFSYEHNNETSEKIETRWKRYTEEYQRNTVTAAL